MKPERLTEIANVFQLYLREVTANQRVFSRVMLRDDPANVCDETYIRIGELEGSDEIEQFVISPPSFVGAGTGLLWSLTQLTYSVSRHEGPTTDARTVLATVSLSEIFRKLAEIMFSERLAAAQQGFDYDLHHPDAMVTQ